MRTVRSSLLLTDADSFGCEVPNQFLIPLTCHDNALFDFRMQIQHGFDFLQLDPISSYLHLVVGATTKHRCFRLQDNSLDLLCGKDEPRIIAERVSDKSLVRLLSAIQVAPCDTFATDIYLAFDSYRHRLKGVV